MDIIGIFILFIIIFLISVVWRYWLNEILRSEARLKLGDESVSPEMEIETEETVERKFFETMKTNVMLNTKPYLKKVLPKKVEQTTIERELKFQYKRSTYVNKAFSLRITIAGKEGKISKDGKKLDRVRPKKLNFKAYEKEPKLTVELKFAEGDFKVNHTKKTQKLKESEETVFDFMVSPLKAEDCILTVVFSYVDKIPVPEKTTEKVIIDKTITPEEGKSTKEHSEQTTKVPIKIVEKEIETRSVDLVISVKSILGLNAKQVDFVKKAAPAAAALIIFAYQIMSGGLEGTDSIIAALPALLAAFGVEGLDKLFGDKTEDDSEETT